MADIDITQQVTEFTWEGNTPPRFRMGAKDPFLTSEGVPVHAWNPRGTQRAFIDVPCTFVDPDTDKRVVIPALSDVPATTDSVDRPNEAEYWAFLYSRGADFAEQYQEFSVFSGGFKLDHENTSPTWEDIRTFNVGAGTYSASLHVADDLSWGGTATGDGSGITDTDAKKLRGREVSSSAPSNGQALAWDNAVSRWVPTSIGGSIAGGNATQLQSRAVSADLPVEGQSLVFKDGAWQPSGVTSAVHVYASTSGAVLDGTTDNAAVLQPLLDLAQSLGTVHVVIDGDCLSGPLDYYGNTAIEIPPGCQLKLADGSNRALLRNANPTTGAVTDKNITIFGGGTLDGNSEEQVGEGLFDTQEPDGTLIGLIQAYGVENFKIFDLNLKHSKSICVHVANSVGTIARGLTFDNAVVGQWQQGGFQFSGPNSKWIVTGLKGSTRDDLFAINPDDADWVNGAFTGLGPYIDKGDITDGVFGDFVITSAWSAVRIFNSDSLIDNIVGGRISGTVSQLIFGNDPLTLTPGNIGTFTLTDVSVEAAAQIDVGYGAFLDVYGTAKNIIFRNIEVRNVLDTRSVLRVNTGADIERLEVSGLGVTETSSTSAGMIPVKIDGRVGLLVGVGWTWTRDIFLAHSEAFLKLTAAASQVEELSLNVVTTNRANRIVYVAAGRLSTLNMTAIRQADCLGGITVNGTVGVVNISNWLGDYAVPFVGTAGKKLGDAFPADTTAPTFSAAVATGSAPFVVVTFSESVNGSNFATGVTIKKNTVTQTISSAKRREHDSTQVEYVLSANISGGDTVTWEYAAGTGNIVDLQSNPLANVSAQSVTVSRTGYVYDLFTASDGTAMNGRTPSPLTAGNNWATLIGTAGLQTVRGNRLRLDASSATQSIAVDAGAANVIIYATLQATHLPDSAAGVGIVFRASDASNYWLAWITRSATTLFKVVAGVATSVDTEAATHYPGVPYQVQVVCNGNSITATVNGGESVSASDAHNNTATKHGVHAGGAVMAADDFTTVSFS